jgi:hypothetical protein
MSGERTLSEAAEAVEGGEDSVAGASDQPAAA